MKILGNIIWLVFGGLETAIEYLIAGVAMMITIIGILFMNVLWFFIGGIWIWLTHIFFGLLLAITIVGIPFAKMHFRMAKIALAPFGKEVI